MLHTNSYSGHQMKKKKWERHVACMEDWRGADWGLVGRLEGKRLLGKPKFRWEDNIKVDF